MILPPRYIRSKKKSTQKKHQQRRSTWRVLNRRITLNFKIIATSFLDDVIMLPWKLQNITDSGYTTKYVVTIFNTSAVQEPRLDTWIYLGRLYPPRFYLPRYYPSWFYLGSLTQKRIYYWLLVLSFGIVSLDKIYLDFIYLDNI